MFAFSPLSCQTKIHLISDCWGLHECGASLDHPPVQFLCAASGWAGAVRLGPLLFFALRRCSACNAGRNLPLCLVSSEVKGVWGNWFWYWALLSLCTHKHRSWAHRRTPFVLSHKHEHTCPPRALIWAPWRQYNKQRCQVRFLMFPVLRICSECVEKGKGSCVHTHKHAHIQLQARNTLGCWIMRVDRAELSLHITIILSFSQLPQHLPWRCDISILLEFNLGPLNKTIAYRPFPNGPSPILITWN